ncbi:hypothetical protein OV203_07995 [Nannocystis sp. ILAH1]|uniref:hypothetical protein n=1 Tax=Nannocystis sp. ILAH1 TaxID=2996789 RepID=UPI00226FD965|nr:hypothetical protein [Nannocystis sp. ILAH1]MCY0987060.1 hypothetical protein [Nannocystis sp. ILAH1]
MSKKPVCVFVALAVSGCDMRPPQAPVEEVQRRAELEVEARAATVQEAQAEEALRAAEAAESAAKERLAAVTAGSEPSSDAELAIYQARLVEAQAVSASCEAPFERLVELHDYLHRFASEPQRDAAIAALEGCRKRAHAARKQEHAAAQVELRREFALEVEAAFDAEHPDARGRLVATVKGEALQVQLRGFFGWRPRDCEAKVQELCDSTAHFRSIVLSAPDGRFACRPRVEPEDYLAQQLRADGLADPWDPVMSGVSATPRTKPPPPPVDPDALARLQHEAVGATHGREAAAAALKHVKGTDRFLRERIHELDRAQIERRTAWQEHRERRYRNFAFASLAPIAAGLGMFVFGSAHLAKLSAIRQGKLEFASQAEYETAKDDAARSTAIGHLVALPLLAAGITMFVLGVRKPRVSGRISVTRDGLLVRF